MGKLAPSSIISLTVKATGKAERQSLGKACKCEGQGQRQRQSPISTHNVAPTSVVSLTEKARGKAERQSLGNALKGKGQKAKAESHQYTQCGPNKCSIPD